MSRKNDILTNLREYSSDQIAEAINEGVVTMYELSKSGNLTPLMRKRIEEKLAGGSTETVGEVHADHSASSVQEEKAVNESPKSQDDEEKMAEPTIPEAGIPEIPKAVIAPATADTVKSKPDGEQEQPTYDEETSDKRMFKRPFSFHGRIRRLEYGISLIIFGLWNTISNALAGDLDTSSVALVNCIGWVVIIWFAFAQACKRCHDLGNSGWFQIIPFYGLWLLFAEGDEGENEYGENPKCKY